MASASSSSSSYSSSSPIEYEVFLSFRGEDTRKTFTGHLYQALESKGVRTFMDEPRLVSGERIADSLWRAIECSAACIVILSEHYADSKWCLKELAKMVQSKKTILPIFFHVDPSHVRKQQGPFKHAFIKYEESSNLPCDNREHIEAEEIMEWTNALNEVGNIKGYDLDEQYKGNESLMIQIVVKRVLNEFMNAIDVAKYPVGIDYRVQKVMDLLNLEASEVRIVGICGMGGIGKTTLAKEIYNRISRRFSACCFIKDIREEVAKKGLVSIQIQLISQICNDENPSIYNVDHGFAMIKRRLNGKCVLIILDDVDKKEQLDSLVGRLDSFGQRSRIIITTRVTTVLNISGIIRPQIYDVDKLNSEESLQLFSQHAFGGKEPIETYKDLSQKIISTTNGLPLALEIIGSDLFDKTSIPLWEEMLEKLKQVPHDNVREKLRISYDGLNEEGKVVFLDIACFLIGYKKEYVVDMLKGCVTATRSAIEDLEHKSILKIDDDNVLQLLNQLQDLGIDVDDRLRMHDQLRDMGRSIAKDSRIYDPTEAWDLLNEHKRMKKVEGVSLEDNFIEAGTKKVEKSLNTEAFAHMPNLRLLIMDNVKLEGGFNKLPSNIRSLRWRFCPLKSLPLDFDLRKVSFLDLSESSIIQLWSQNSIKVFHNLKVLYLDYCKQLMGCLDLSCFPNLEKLSLRRCERLVSIHESLGCLTRLIDLNLDGCLCLTELPDSIGKLRKLRRLNLGYTAIKQLPDTMGSLENLEILEAPSCYQLKELPDSIKSLTKLEELNLRCCSSLVISPDSIAYLTRLKILNMDGNHFSGPGLDSIGCLTRLEELGLGYSLKPISLDGLCNLRSLSKLYIRSVELEKFPDWIGPLENLKILSIRCHNGLEFPINSTGCFTKLEELQLFGTSSWRALIHFIDCLQGLLRLSLFWDEDMEELPECIGSLENLKILSISSCPNLRQLPNSIGSLTQLGYLYLHGCGSLRTLPDSLGNLTSLFGLGVEGAGIEQLPNSMQFLRNVRYLNVERCWNLRGPLPLREMTSLECLEVRDEGFLRETIEGENEGEGRFQVAENVVDVIGHCQRGQDYMRVSLPQDENTLQTWNLDLKVGNNERTIEVINRGEHDSRQWMRLIFPSDFVVESVKTTPWNLQEMIDRLFFQVTLLLNLLRQCLGSS